MNSSTKHDEQHKLVSTSSLRQANFESQIGVPSDGRYSYVLVEYPPKASAFLFLQFSNLNRDCSDLLGEITIKYHIRDPYVFRRQAK